MSERSFHAILGLGLVSWVLFGAFTCSGLLVSGCGGAPQVARQVVAGAAIGVNEIDVVSAEAYTEAAQDALEASVTLSEYEEAMYHWNQLEAALRGSHEALLAAEGALDVWDAGGSEEWGCLAGRLLSALAHLVAIVQAIGLEVPEELDTVLSLAEAAGAILCE